MSAVTLGKRKEPPSNSDDEAAAEVERESAQLDWRMDPEESNSNWTIIISVNGTTHSKYHVHKHILSFGRKKSKYFETLFRNEEMEEHAAKTSTIGLHDLTAEAFPNLLDFMYSCNSSITAEKSVALYQLGDQLDVPSIRSEARAFWKNSLDIRESFTCFQRSKILNCDKASKGVADRVLKRLPDQIADKDKTFIASTNLEFWLELLRANEGKPHQKLSIWIAHFCSVQKKETDASTLTSTLMQLTDLSVLPELHPNAAYILLQLEEDNGSLSPLQERCVEPVAKHWKMHSHSNHDLLLLSPFLLSKVMTRSLEIARGLSKRNENTIRRMLFSCKLTITGATDFPQVNGPYKKGCFVGSEHLDGEEIVWSSFIKEVHNEQEENFGIWCQPDRDDGTFRWTIEPASQEQPELYYQAFIPSLDVPPEQGWQKRSPDGGWVDAPELRCKHSFFE